MIEFLLAWVSLGAFLGVFIFVTIILPALHELGLEGKLKYNLLEKGCTLLAAIVIFGIMGGMGLYFIFVSDDVRTTIDEVKNEICKNT